IVSGVVGGPNGRVVPRAVRFLRDRAANTRVHPSTQQHYSFPPVAQIASDPLLPLPHTPFVAGSHTNLCSCKPSRTGSPSSSIHSTNCRGSSPFHFPSGSSHTG